MVNTAKRPRFILDDVVSALSATPRRTRTALEGLRWMFQHGSDTPPALLMACAQLLNHDEATSTAVLDAVRAVRAEWDSYGATERELYSRCVYTSETRRTVAVTELADITAMVRATPPQRATALDALRWTDAETLGTQRELFTACAVLLKNPSATAPAIVDAIHTGHRLWPALADDARGLLMACVYASKERAQHAQRRRAAQQAQREAESGDLHRCGGCDGSLAATPDMEFCSDACRRIADAEPQPAPTVPAARAHTHEPAEQRAQRDYVVGPIEAEYDEQYRRIEHAIPRVHAIRKDDGVADAYEGERARTRDTDERGGYYDHHTKTGYDLSDEDYERQALRAVRPGALCTACNLERTRAEHGDPTGDGRCAWCVDGGKPPLIAGWAHGQPIPWIRELAAA